MTLSVKCLWCKEDLSSDFQHPSKKLGVRACTGDVETGRSLELAGQPNQQSPKAPGSMTVPKAKTKVEEKTRCQLLVSTHEDTHTQPLISTKMYTHEDTYTYTHIFTQKKLQKCMKIYKFIKIGKFFVTHIPPPTQAKLENKQQTGKK